MNDEENKSIAYEVELHKWKCEMQDKQLRGEFTPLAIGMAPPFQNIDYEKLGISGKRSTE